MAQGKPTLHHMNDSNSQKVLWAIEELGIPYNLELHHRQTSGKDKGRAPLKLKETHVLGKAPQFVTADGRVIIESTAMIKYLINTYDTSKKFQGDDGKNDIYRDDELTAIADASIGPIMILELLLSIATIMSPFFVRPLIGGMHSMMRKAFTGQELEKMFQYLNDQLGDQDYFMGTSPGHADFMISWPTDMCTANDFINIKKFPKLDAWYDRIHQRDAWKRSIEKGNGYNLNIKSSWT